MSGIYERVCAERQAGPFYPDDDHVTWAVFRPLCSVCLVWHCLWNTWVRRQHPGQFFDVGIALYLWWYAPPKKPWRRFPTASVKGVWLWARPACKPSGMWFCLWDANIITGLILALGRVSGETAPSCLRVPLTSCRNCRIAFWTNAWHCLITFMWFLPAERIWSHSFPLAYGTALVLILIFNYKPVGKCTPPVFFQQSKTN